MTAAVAPDPWSMDDTTRSDPRAIGDGHRPAPPAQLGDPEGDKRSVTELEAEEVGASLK
jgi:hypothetical protein